MDFIPQPKIKAMKRIIASSLLVASSILGLSDYYRFNWLPNAGGYPEGTVAGDIARVACGNY